MVTSLLPVMQTIVMGSTGVQRKDSCGYRNYWITWLELLVWPGATHMSVAADSRRKMSHDEEARGSSDIHWLFLKMWRGIICMYERMYVW